MSRVRHTLSTLIMSATLAVPTLAHNLPRPRNWAELTRMMTFDPQRDADVVAKTKTIMLGGPLLPQLRKRAECKRVQRIRRTLTNAGVSKETQDKIFAEHEKILAQRRAQHAGNGRRVKARHDRSIPYWLRTYICEQLRAAGFDPDQVEICNQKKKGARAASLTYVVDGLVHTYISLDVQDLAACPRNHQEATIDHEIGHLAHHDSILWPLIRQQCGNTLAKRVTVQKSINHAMEYGADQHAATMSPAHAVKRRNATAAWYNSYGAADFFHAEDEHPSPFSRFAKLNKMVHRLVAAEMLEHDGNLLPSCKPAPKKTNRMLVVIPTALAIAYVAWRIANVVHEPITA